MTKFVSIILALILTLSPILIVGSNTNPIFDEVIEAIYEAHIMLYSSLIVTGFGMPPTQTVMTTIPRASFAVIVARLIEVGGYDLDGIEGLENIFPDIIGIREGLSHWAESDINTLFEMEVITGDPDGNFRPDDMITEHEAITMIVRALNHGERGIKLGGFPFGYLQVADELGILKNTIMNIENERKNLLRGNFYLLLFNALEYR